MKLFVFLFFLLFFVSCGDDSSSTSTKISGSENNASAENNASDIVDGSFTDSRDGQSYKVAVIGEQTWMAENLNYKADSSFCYNDQESNCGKYGRLYQWSEAQQACPSGWHLPSKSELETLIETAGGTESAGKMLKSSLGLSSGLAGLRNYDGSFSGESSFAYFWTDTDRDSTLAYNIILYADNDAVRFGNRVKTDALNVRCLKD